MTVMQQAFAEAEKQLPKLMSKEQRIWNIVKSKPWITLNEIVQRMGIARMDVTFTVTRMVDRGMLDKRSQRPPGPKMGRTPNEYKCMHDTYVLLPLPKKEKKPEAKPVTKVEDIRTALMPGYSTNPLPEYTPTLLERVKAAPFSEVQEIYAWMKDTFK